MKSYLGLGFIVLKSSCGDRFTKEVGIDAQKKCDKFPVWSFVNLSDQKILRR